MYSQTYPTNLFELFRVEEIEQAIHSRFEQRVAQHPLRIAIRTRDHELTYAQLNERSNRIARTLVEHRGTTAEPVALLFHQGINAITTILGVLKAGKFYVPLDPGHPPERITRMLKTSQAALLVTEGRHLALATKLGWRTPQVIDVEQIDAELPSNNLEQSVSPEALAYIFFTSGSTGVPKGVMDNHRHVLHNVMRYTNSLHIGKSDRLSLLQSCTFSGTVSSLFGALSNGACIVPIDLRNETSASLVGWLHRQKVTIYHSVPAIFRNFLQNDIQRFPDVRVVRLEGDQASGIDVKLYKQHFSRDCILVNGLGTTETGLVSQYFMDQDSAIPPTVVPVGYPVEDMEVVILNEDGEAVTPNTVGEIAVRSPYLSLGYWNRPDLTSQAYITDAQNSQQRIYKTGDLGRIRKDGCLDILGRKDSRVKVRGKTVELTEIEAALLELDSIQQAVVTAKEDAPNELSLVAFLVPLHSTVPSVTLLRDHLSDLLPAFMIPSAYVTLESLPLDANGKVDRTALPSPPSSRSFLDCPFMRPETVTHQQLQKIWEDLLGISPIGIQDDFFKLGGDSLLAVSMIDKVEREFGLELPISVLVSNASIESLAEVVLHHKIQCVETEIEMGRDLNK